MTVEQPQEIAHIWFVNGTDDFPIDVYANDMDEPLMSDASPLEVGAVYEVDGSDGRAFGSYKFDVREKDETAGPPLASATVDMQQGCSYSAAFHVDGAGGYALSVYANDFTAAANTHLEIRHAGHAPRIDWQIRPRDGADDRIQADSRSGSLQRSQWQRATEMLPNDYLLEVGVDGTLMAFLPDLQLEQEKKMVVYYVGTPLPAQMQSNELRAYLITQDFRIDTGTLGEAKVSEPAPPLNGDEDGDAGKVESEEDSKVVFDGRAIETFEASPAGAEIRATDPSGKVTKLALDRVEPAAAGISIPAEGVTPSPRKGAAAVAQIAVAADVPAGQYSVWVAAFTGGKKPAAACKVPVTVKPMTVQRLCERIAGFRVVGDVQTKFAVELTKMLDSAEADFADGRLDHGRDMLTRFLERVEDGSGGPLTEPAAAALARETRALQSALGCA